MNAKKANFHFKGGDPGVHLTRFWSRTCHRGFKNIPVPCNNVFKQYTRPYTNFSKSISDLLLHANILPIGTVPYTEIVKIDTVLYLYTNIWKIYTLPDGTSPNPKYM